MRILFVSLIAACGVGTIIATVRVWRGLWDTLMVVTLSFAVLLGLLVGLAFTYRDLPPVVSPAEELVRAEAAELYRQGAGHVRASELLANWHYTTKKLCGTNDKACYEDRAAHYLEGGASGWAQWASFTRTERQCTELRSDRYGVCLMRNWWQLYTEETGNGTQETGGFVSLSRDKHLRALACERDNDSKHYCHTNVPAPDGADGSAPGGTPVTNLFVVR